MAQEKLHPLQEIYENLNQAGKERLNDFAEFVSEIPRYRKNVVIFENIANHKNTDKSRNT